MIHKSGLFLVALFLSIHLFSQSDSTVGLQKKWLKAYNQGEDMSTFYSPASGLFVADSITTEPALIAQRLNDLQQKWGELSTYQTDEILQIRKNQKIEVGTYTNSNGQKYRTLIAWRIKDHWKKEFEVIYPAAEASIPEGLMAMLTEAWEDRSKAHRPDLIVEELYVDQGYYFNQGRVYRGAEVAEVYNYMTNPDWTIVLESMTAVPCYPETILNVGTYTSGGKGLYILLWKKVKSEWKLLLDFNF